MAVSNPLLNAPSRTFPLTPDPLPGYQVYKTSATGLGPLAWAWYDDTGNSFRPQLEQDSAALFSANEKGWFMSAGTENWFSRPEPNEALFYAYRITGEQRWRDYAWENWMAMNRTARTKEAFAAVNNVDVRGGGSMSDNLDS